MATARSCTKSRGDVAFGIVNGFLLFLFALFTLMPIINILATSLSTHSLPVVFWPAKWDGFAMWSVLTEAKFYQAFFISICVTVCGTIISVLCMMLAAYPLSKRELPLRRTIMIYFFISMLFSGGMVPNYILVSSLGLTNTLFAMILPNAVMVFHLILMKAFFEGIPPALEESARIDGAGNLRILFSIVMPISMSMLVTVCLFTAVVYWNNYFNALMYISASHSELYPLPFYIINLSDQFRDPNAPIVMGDKFKYEQNIIAATIILSMLPICLTYPFFLKYFTKGVVVGAVKG